MEEKDIKEVEKKAKEILDKFSKSLASVKGEEEWNVERKDERRKEGEGKSCDKEFREIFFRNAPKKDEDFLIAEKKTW
jgi:aspartyl-tRNA(Asn)/glutamyl-tRNA(Gln) amidotransferase subunit C